MAADFYQLLTRMDKKFSGNFALLQDHLAAIDQKISKMEGKQRELDQDLKCVAQGMGGVDKTQSAEREEGSGRTVLKERYKKALKLDRGPLANIPAPDAWIELIFGIRAPDQRMGKEGSRFLFENMTEYTATNPLI